MSVNYTVANGILTITVPVDAKSLKAAPSSKSGKTRVVGTTNGFVKVEGLDGVAMGLNVIVR